MYFQDITDQKRAQAEYKKAEQALHKALAEREALLKEMHHRVKNNLQVISSLLEMQAHQVNEPRALALFEEACNRVVSIATIHEQLYRSDSFAKIELAPYARRLKIVYRHKRLRSRRLITVLGPVSIARRDYSCPGQYNLYPRDALLGLPARSYSSEVQRRLVKAAVQGPFDEAVEELADALGISLSRRTAEQIVADASVDFESFDKERSLRLAPESGPLLIPSVDGKGVPMVQSASGERKVRLGRGEKRNKKRRSTVGRRLYPKTQHPDARGCGREFVCRVRPASLQYWLSPARTETGVGQPALEQRCFIAQVQAEMRRRDPQHRKTWIVVTDGERALQRKVAATFQAIELVLDLLPVLEKLWGVSYVFHPEASPEAREFVKERIQRILRGE